MVVFRLGATDRMVAERIGTYRGCTGLLLELAQALLPLCYGTVGGKPRLVPAVVASALAVGNWLAASGALDPFSGLLVSLAMLAFVVAMLKAASNVPSGAPSCLHAIAAACLAWTLGCSCSGVAWLVGGVLARLPAAGIGIFLFILGIFLEGVHALVVKAASAIAGRPVHPAVGMPVAMSYDWVVAVGMLRNGGHPNSLTFILTLLGTLANDVLKNTGVKKSVIRWIVNRGKPPPLDLHDLLLTIRIGRMNMVSESLAGFYLLITVVVHEHMRSEFATLDLFDRPFTELLHSVSLVILFEVVGTVVARYTVQKRLSEVLPSLAREVRMSRQGGGDGALEALDVMQDLPESLMPGSFLELILDHGATVLASLAGVAINSFVFSPLLNYDVAVKLGVTMVK
jgi:hypothetical protein